MSPVRLWSLPHRVSQSRAVELGGVDCAVADDLDFPVGDASDPNMVAALSYVQGAGCPAALSADGQQKADFLFDSTRPDLQGPPEREFADAF